MPVLDTPLALTDGTRVMTLAAINAPDEPLEEQAMNSPARRNQKNPTQQLPTADGCCK